MRLWTKRRAKDPWPLSERPKPDFLVGGPIQLNAYCSLSGARVSIGEGGHITVADKSLLVDCIITIPHWPLDDFVTVKEGGTFVNNWINERETNGDSD